MSSAGKKFAPGRLWSLWDMLTYLFGAFYHELRALRSTVEMLDLTKNRPDDLDDKFYLRTITSLESLRDGCTELDLTQSVNRINRIISHISLKRDHNYLRIHLADLEPGLRDEGARHLICTIPADRGELLHMENPDFWNGVTTAFPSAHDDCESALYCYACDEGTASVFHSMRILECG
jgi:hypothetical protein